MGRIITFYSYKGGTGRSMALANIGWILASNGHRVLMVDWDIEAPGLHRYLSPFLSDGELVQTEGIIDIVHDFALQAMTPFDELPSASIMAGGSQRQDDSDVDRHQTISIDVEKSSHDWFLPLADVSRYAVSLRYPHFPRGSSLDFLPAGLQGPGYAARCNGFDWGRFYERLNGFAFVDALKASMRQEYDFTLIDSRTGVSDTSGICTIQMPDDVVICFTPNNQGILGAAETARSIRSQRRLSDTDPVVRIFPVPMRLDTSEKEKLDERMALTRECFDEFLDLPREERDDYWKDVSVPYWPFYAFEETLAVFGDLPAGVNTLLSAYERIAGRLVSQKIVAGPPAEEERRIVQAAFARRPTGLIDWQVPRIFISYARKDGAELAASLRRDLTKEGFEVWLDTDRIGGETWTTEIEEALDQSQIVLALLTPASYISEICRAEQLRSLRKGKCVIPILAQPGADIPVHLGAKNYLDLTTRPYAPEFQKLLQDIDARKGVKLKPEYRSTYVTVPPLPRNYVDRPGELASLRNSLVTDGGGPSIALTALEGMGGIGKTVLAQALCQDEVIQQAFPDGIIWTTAGKESTYPLITRMQEMRRALGDEPPDGESELQCINRYRSVIREKAVLIVVDDVWRSEDVEPFRAESPRSRLLFTTRDASIAAEVGAEEHIADLLTPEQSRDVLGRWSGTDVNHLPLEAAELIRECGRLPLALSMVGTMLRGKSHAYWAHVHDLLRNAQPGLFRAIQVSVDALELSMRERYLALAVLLEDMSIQPAIQQALWNADEFEALNTAELFVSLSLAQRDGDNSVRLHDLQLDYLRAQYPDHEALELIHGALRLSSHVLAQDPYQFASQIVGRLLSHDTQPTVQRFTASLTHASPRPWLRPLQPTLDPPGTGLLRTLVGHSAAVSGVVVSPDGRRAMSACWDNTLKVWDLETGRELHTLAGHSDSVRGLAVSSDWRRAVSTSSDNTLKVWDVETGRELRTLTGHSGAVYGVAVSSDGRRAVSASSDNTLKVWDLETGRELRTLAGHSASVDGVAMSPDGRRAVSASSDNTLKVWDLETGSELRTLAGHSAPVDGVALSPDGRRAVSASSDNTLKVWDLETGRELRTLVGHSASVNGVAVSPDGRRAVSASWDRTLKVWDLESGRELRTLAGHSDSVDGVALSPDGRRAVSASSDTTLKVWDLETDRQLHTLPGHSDSVMGVAASVDGRRALSGSKDNTLKVWNLETGRELLTLAGHSSYVSGVAVSVDWRRVASASLDKTLKVWDVETGRELRTLAGHSGPVYGVAMSSDGRRAVSASADETLKVWDLETGRDLRTLVGHSSYVSGVALSPEGRRAVSASGDNTLKVWDLETGRELRTLAGHSDAVSGVALSPEGRRAVSASWDRALKVWDLENGRELRTLTGHSDRVWGVSVSADGRRAVSASWDATLKVWDLESGENVATFTCDAAAICCAFAGNHTIIAGDTTGHVHFLSLELPQQG